MQPTVYLRFVKREHHLKTDLENIVKIVDRMVLQQWWANGTFVSGHAHDPLSGHGEWRDVEVSDA